MAILKFNEHSNQRVKHEFATGKKVESKFKDRDGNAQYQYMWRCNGDDIIYASPSLNAMLMQEKEGSNTGVEVEIKKVDSGNKDPKGDSIFVFAVNNRTMDMRNKGEEPPIDADTRNEIEESDIPF